MPPILLLLLLSSADLEAMRPLSDPYPLLRDRERFPSREVCWDMMCFLKERRSWLELQSQTHLHQSDYWQEELTRVRWLYSVWDTMHNSHEEVSWSPVAQHAAMILLRELLGESAWTAGQMPFPTR